MENVNQDELKSLTDEGTESFETKEQVVENSVDNQTGEDAPESLREQILSKLDKIKKEEDTQNSIIATTTEKVENLQRELGMQVGGDIPSIEENKKKVILLEEERVELESRLNAILSSDVSHKHEDAIGKIRDSKIDWANSAELERRLKLKGATDEDVVQVREWLVNNAMGAKTFVLPSQKFADVVDVLNQMTGDNFIKEAEAFHVPGGKVGVPDNIKSSIFVQEKPARPPLPGGGEAPKPTIDERVLRHEYGHVTQDGLLESELYKDYNPKIKEGARDPEYVGWINETDVRIRSMFHDLSDSFDPKTETFGKAQLDLIKEKSRNGQLSRDTQDLLDHYDDGTIIELANTLPAI